MSVGTIMEHTGWFESFSQGAEILQGLKKQILHQRYLVGYKSLILHV